MNNLWLVGLWTYQFLDISHIDWKRDKKRKKYGSIMDKNGISWKRTEKPLSRFRKYGNGIPQIRKRTEESRKRNGSGQDFFLSVFNLTYKAPFLLFRCMLIVKAPIPVLLFVHNRHIQDFFGEGLLSWSHRLNATRSNEDHFYTITPLLNLWKAPYVPNKLLLLIVQLQLLHPNKTLILSAQIVSC